MSVHFASKGDVSFQQSEYKKACTNTDIPSVLEVLHNCCICRHNYSIKRTILKILGFYDVNCYISIMAQPNTPCVRDLLAVQQIL